LVQSSGWLFGAKDERELRELERILLGADARLEAGEAAPAEEGTELQSEFGGAGAMRTLAAFIDENERSPGKRSCFAPE